MQLVMRLHGLAEFKSTGSKLQKLKHKTEKKQRPPSSLV